MSSRIVVSHAGEGCQSLRYFRLPLGHLAVFDPLHKDAVGLRLADQLRCVGGLVEVVVEHLEAAVDEGGRPRPRKPDLVLLPGSVLANERHQPIGRVLPIVPHVDEEPERPQRSRQRRRPRGRRRNQATALQRRLERVQRLMRRGRCCREVGGREAALQHRRCRGRRRVEVERLLRRQLRDAVRSRRGLHDAPGEDGEGQRPHGSH
mmetsp:Transcript_69827/g.195729  ORF Transcript_69827/g.195729 Transcript_69827/m.195729 type:complete len:206 (+) Transcript_69827:965-1582(+)